MINLNSHLANLKGVRNGMEIDTDLDWKNTYSRVRSGPGINSIRPYIRFSSSILFSRYEILLKQLNKINPPMSDFSELFFQYYFYIEALDIPGVMASITSLLASRGVGIESIVQKEELNAESVPIILITDPF